MTKKVAIDRKALNKSIAKYLELVRDDPAFLNEMQYEVLSILCALRLALKAPDFEDEEANLVLNQIYDNMIDITDGILALTNREKK